MHPWCAPSDLKEQLKQRTSHMEGELRRLHAARAPSVPQPSFKGTFMGTPNKKTKKKPKKQINTYIYIYIRNIIRIQGRR